MANVPISKDSPGQVDLSFTRGNVFSRRITFPNPPDLTGYTFKSYLTLNGSRFQEITCTQNILDDQIVDISLTKEQTANLPDELHWYFNVIDGSGNPRTYLEGTVYVNNPGV